MKDALGVDIREGWAAQVDAGRGASSIKKVYVVGTKGASVVIIGKRWGGGHTQDMIEAWQAGNKEVPTYPKTPTRIIMLGETNG